MALSPIGDYWQYWTPRRRSWEQQSSAKRGSVLQLVIVGDSTGAGIRSGRPERGPLRSERIQPLVARQLPAGVQGVHIAILSGSVAPQLVVAYRSLRLDLSNSPRVAGFEEAVVSRRPCRRLRGERGVSNLHIYARECGAQCPLSVAGGPHQVCLVSKLGFMPLGDGDQEFEVVDEGVRRSGALRSSRRALSNGRCFRRSRWSWSSQRMQPSSSHSVVPAAVAWERLTRGRVCLPRLS